MISHLRLPYDTVCISCIDRHPRKRWLQKHDVHTFFFSLWTTLLYYTFRVRQVNFYWTILGMDHATWCGKQYITLSLRIRRIIQYHDHYHYQHLSFFFSITSYVCDNIWYMYHFSQTLMSMNRTFALVAVSGDEDGSPDKGRWGCWKYWKFLEVSKRRSNQPVESWCKKNKQWCLPSLWYFSSLIQLAFKIAFSAQGSGWAICLVERIRSAGIVLVHEGCSWLNWSKGGVSGWLGEDFVTFQQENLRDEVWNFTTVACFRKLVTACYKLMVGCHGIGKMNTFKNIDVL